MKYDIIIIGAGATGLMAMKELVRAGYRVCLLEAASKAGGRIETIEEDFHEPVETGAEFIHGNLPLTLQLLKEGNIPYHPIEGKMMSVEPDGEEEEGHDEHWGQFMKQLSRIRNDTTIGEFLEKYFPGPEYAHLHFAVKGFAEGFDLADANKASVFALRKEWSSQEDERQYRIEGGYGRMIDYLVDACSHENSSIQFNACATKIEHGKNGATIYTTDNRKFEATKLIITVSLGVLRSGNIEFVPALPALAKAMEELGFGTVIKVLMQFKTPFWKSHYENLGFLLSHEEIPTWWTQLPVDNNILTGWLGGPRAAAKASDSYESLLESSLQSLASIFKVTRTFLEEELIHHKIICWSRQPYIMGGYSYVTPRTEELRHILLKPVNRTVFFAGEALAGGDSQGTVEAALDSGRAVADLIKGYMGPNDG